MSLNFSYRLEQLNFLKQKAKNLLSDESGQGMTEYVILAACIGLFPLILRDSLMASVDRYLSYILFVLSLPIL
jgi:Flp pilus assembly pilin Flp